MTSVRTRFFANSRSVATTYSSQPSQQLLRHDPPVHSNNYKYSTNTPYFGPTPHISEIPPSNLPDDADVLDPSEEELDDMAQTEFAWSHSTQSADDGATPSVCHCHAVFKGSCPSFKTLFIQQIVQCNSVHGANMDGARVTILDPPFSADVWRKALGSYFDAHELVAALQFGWDMDFFQVPTPKDAQRNNGSAVKYPEHVLHYVHDELAHGCLVGPFKPSELPFPVFRSPFGSVDKVKSFWRRIVTDCSQLTVGINAFIDPSSHRGKPWKLKLPNSMAIVHEIKRVRRRFPGQKVHIWKSDMSRWYRWFRIDPKCVPFFAVQWDGLTYLDAALSFGNRGAALAAQRFIWAVGWIYRTQVSPYSGVSNLGASCSCPSHCECGSNSALEYIDDVLGFSPHKWSQHNFDSFLALAASLGLRLSKTEGHISPPATVCICLGLEYDTENNTVSFPQAKLEALILLLKDWLARPKATEKELASI